MSRAPHRPAFHWLVVTLVLLTVLVALPVLRAEDEDEAGDDPEADAVADWMNEILALAEQAVSSVRKFYFDRDDGSFGVCLLGNVRFVGTDFVLYADAMGVHFPPPVEGEKRRSYRIYAVGNIVLTREGQVFRAESLLYDRATRTAILTRARVRIERWFLERVRQQLKTGDSEWFSSLEAAPGDYAFEQRTATESDAAARSEGRVPTLVIAARELRAAEFRRFSGRDLQVTTCVFGEPHWSVTADRGEVTRGEGGESLDIELEGVGIEGWFLPRIPLPPVSFNTEWLRSVPLRRVSYSSSSKYGNRIDTLWDGTLLVPGAIREPLDLDLGIRADHLSQRGVGYGSEWEYGTPPSRWSQNPSGIDSYGRGVYHAIDDRGEDANDVEPDHQYRYRVRGFHRSRLPTRAYVDVEFSDQRDRNFLDEYFESEVRNVKPPESLAYLRQPLGESSAVTLLGKSRFRRFERDLERMPELSYFLIDRPLGETGVDLDVVARASQLRNLSDHTDPVPSRRMARADLLTQVAYPFGSSRRLRVRPFFETRLSAWEQGATRSSSTQERLSLASGARVGTHLARSFDVQNEWLGLDGLRHVIDPEVSYRILFQNNKSPDELFEHYDDTEKVDRFERVTFALRNFLFTRVKRGREAAPRRRPGAAASTREPEPAGAGASEVTETRRIVEAEFEIDYFPDPNRDNSPDSSPDNTGDTLGPLRGELLLFPHRGLSFFTETEVDVQGRSRIGEFATGASYHLQGGQTVLIENRYTRHRAHTITASYHAPLGDRYEVLAQFQYDVRESRSVNQNYALVRHFHRWSLVFAVEVDDGEDNVEFKVQFGLRELLSIFSGRDISTDRW